MSRTIATEAARFESTKREYERMQEELRTKEVAIKSLQLECTTAKRHAGQLILELECLRNINATLEHQIMTQAAEKSLRSRGPCKIVSKVKRSSSVVRRHNRDLKPTLSVSLHSKSTGTEVPPKKQPRRKKVSNGVKREPRQWRSYASKEGLFLEGRYASKPQGPSIVIRSPSEPKDSTRPEGEQIIPPAVKRRSRLDNGKHSDSEIMLVTAALEREIRDLNKYEASLFRIHFSSLTSCVGIMCKFCQNLPDFQSRKQSTKTSKQ